MPADQRSGALKLSAARQRHLLTLHAAGGRAQAALAELFGVARSTVYRAVRHASLASSDDATTG